MSTEVLLQPLYGSSKDGPVSSLLTIDGFKVLLDCGWSEPYNVELLAPLKEYVPRYKLVIFCYSQFNMLHMHMTP